MQPHLRNGWDTHFSRSKNVGEASKRPSNQELQMPRGSDARKYHFCMRHAFQGFAARIVVYLGSALRGSYPATISCSITSCARNLVISKTYPVILATRHPVLSSPTYGECHPWEMAEIELFTLAGDSANRAI
jgi:hypothetical protein